MVAVHSFTSTKNPQKIKQKNELREDKTMEQNLNRFKQRTFQVKSRCALSLLTAKLTMANAELSLKLGRNVILNIYSRIKSIESIREKCKKKGIKPEYTEALEKISDILGIRAVCAFEDDIYRVADILCQHQDVTVIRKKDYVRYPKISGYRSLHLIVEIPVCFQGETSQVRAEIQLRTTAMDFWAGVDHELRYKKGKKEAVLIGNELREYSRVVAELDEKMVELRRQIEII